MTAIVPARFRALVLAILAIAAIVIADKTGLDGGLVDAVMSGVDDALFTDPDGRDLEQSPVILPDGE